jgi:hypothetical protein
MALSQDKIGLRRFLEGMISKEITNIQQQYYAVNGSRMSLEKRCSRLITRLLEIMLEPSKTGTYARYPYQELHGYSTLKVQLLSGTIPVTWHRFHVFPRGVISQDH